LLVVLLDGVAYERVHGLYAAGRFRRFRPPARLISVFPTLTDPAYDLLFGTGPTPGYEAGYFDRQANRLTGALRTYLRGGNEAWVRHVDYRLSFLKDAIMYLFPKWVYRSELARARRVLNRRLRAGSRQVVLYILSTDGLAHMLAPAEIDMQLLVLERWIERVAGDWGDELDMVLLSDHGLGRLPPDCTHIQRFDLGAALRAAGLRLVKRLQRPGDVALPLFGLLDVARLHTFDADTRQRAVGVLRGRAEVELVAERDGDRVRVFTAGATAAIRCRCDALGAPRYSYEPEVGDALRLAEACRALRRAGQMDAAGFATGAAWLAATADADFPAAPERLWEAFFSICREQPDTVVSLTERWYVGSGLLSRFVRLQGTHGGLHRRGTETFAMATSLNLPSPLDLRQLAEFLRRELGWPPGPPRG
jgi:hypothetical protein